MYGRTILANVGHYVYVGQAASLDYFHKLETDVGSYTYTGQAADLTTTFAGTLLVNTGLYIISGQPSIFIPSLFPALCDTYNFKKEAKVYIIFAGNQYLMDISSIDFGQTFMEHSYSSKTLQSPNMFEQSIINKANPANFSLNFPALREDDLRILFDRALDYNTFEMYVETAQDSFKIETCVVTNATFVVEKNMPLRMALEGQAAKVTKFVGTIPGTPIARSGTMTYNRISDLKITLGGSNILSNSLASVSIELQNQVKWTPYATINQALTASNASTSMYPASFSVSKRILAGTITRYLVDTDVADLFQWTKNTTLHIEAGQIVSSTFYGFDLDITNCALTNRVGTGEVFTQSYDWRMTQNPVNLSDIVTYITT